MKDTEADNPQAQSPTIDPVSDLFRRSIDSDDQRRVCELCNQYAADFELSFYDKAGAVAVFFCDRCVYYLRAGQDIRGDDVCALCGSTEERSRSRGIRLGRDFWICICDQCRRLTLNAGRHPEVWNDE
jgi:hypothetical protein